MKKNDDCGENGALMGCRSLNHLGRDSSSSSSSVHPITMKPKPHKKTITTHFQKPPSPAENPSDYAFKITKTAVSQICQSVGFKTTQLSALETLTHVATLCLQTLPKQLYYIPMRLTVLNQTSLTSSTHYMTCILYEVSQEGPHCIVIVVA